jgi:hypothetical protein
MKGRVQVFGENSGVEFFQARHESSRLCKSIAAVNSQGNTKLQQELSFLLAKTN